MDKQLTKTPYVGLDIGKFLCALLILFYHYFSENGSPRGILGEVLSLYAIAVALFMTISGFLLFEKLEFVPIRLQRWKIVWKQVKRILTIYAIWSIPYLMFTVYTWDWSRVSTSFVLWQIQGWIFKSTFSTIWFMPTLAMGMLLTFGVCEFFPKGLVTCLAIVMYIIGSLLMTYSFIGEVIPKFDIFARFADTWLGGARGWMFYAFPLLLIGKRLVSYKTKFKSFRMMAFSFMSMLAILAEALLLRKFVGHTGIDMTLMMIPVVCFILGFLVSLQLPNGHYNVWMRKMSTLIFMTQRLFLTILPALLSSNIMNSIMSSMWVGCVFICGLTLCFSQLLIAFSKRIPQLKQLY